VIDIHCHILPDVDDGPKSWDVSEQMCRMAAQDGIEHIVATPHANDRFNYDRVLLENKLDQLRHRNGAKPALSLGCDFHLSYDNLQKALVEPATYAIHRSRYMLVELSNYSIPTQIDDCFNQLLGIGITPILTHPERNPLLQQSMQRVLGWIQQGCVVQVTASAVTGAWGERVWRAAHWLLKRNAVHVLASDAHDDKHRVPGLSLAREAVGDDFGEEVAQFLVDGNPRAVIEGQDLPYLPDPVMKS
jgi:protein-tyrosine phosphatase